MNLVKKLFSNGAVVAISVGLQFLAISLVGKQDPELLGYLNFIEIIIAFIPAVVLFGGDAFFQFKINQLDTEESRLDFLRTYFNMGAALVGIIVLITSLIVWQGMLKININLLVVIVSMLTVTFTSYFLSFLYRSNLRILKGVLYERALLASINTAIIICILILGFELDSTILLCIVLLASFGGLCFSSYVVFGKLGFTKFNWSESKKLICNRKTIFFWITGILIFVYERVDQIFVASVFGYVLLGYYFACYKLSFFVRMFTSIVYSYIYPHLAKLQKNNKNKAIELFHESSQLTVSVAVTFSLPLFFFPSEILGFAFSPEFAEYSNLLKIMAVSTIFSCINQVNYAVVNSQGKSGIIFSNAVVSVLIQFAIIAAFYNTHQLYALAYARLGASVFGVIVSYLVLGKSYLNRIALAVAGLSLIGLLLSF